MVLLRSGAGAVAHVDPATVEPPSSPNWALAAPDGIATTGAKTMEAPLWPGDPAELMAAFEAVALAAPRTERVDHGEDQLWRSYRQRSRLFGFPDYVSARAVLVDTPAGPRASLVVYSRSVYGSSDLGVNRKRLRRWIGNLSAARPPEG